jgi:hypothetical protein
LKKKKDVPAGAAQASHPRYLVGIAQRQTLDRIAHWHTTIAEDQNPLRIHADDFCFFYFRDLFTSFDFVPDIGVLSSSFVLGLAVINTHH